MILQLNKSNSNNISYLSCRKTQKIDNSENKYRLDTLKGDTCFFKGQLNPEKIVSSSKIIDDLLRALTEHEFVEVLKQNPVETMKGIIAIQKALKKLAETSSEIPRGIVEKIGNKIKIMSFDSDSGLVETGKLTEIKLRKGLKFYEPGVPAEEIRNTAFKERPYVTLGPVGWSNVKPDFIDKKLCDMSVYGSVVEQKKALQKGYEKAFKLFITPVYEYLEQNGLKLGKMPMVASFSDSGIDQIVHKHAVEKGVDLVTTGPYRFAEYISKEKEFPFSIALTNTVEDYGTLFSKIADITLVTGGRDHAFLFDAQNQFIGNKGTTIPVDLMKLYYDIEIPALRPDGSIENAAALLKELGLNPFNDELRKEFDKLPSKGKELLEKDEQKALATIMYRIYKSRERAASLVID